MIKVLLFASLREALGASELHVEIEMPTTVAQLKQAAAQLDPEITRLYEQNQLNVAVNLTISSDQDRVEASDEVAFFPPVTGG